MLWQFNCRVVHRWLLLIGTYWANTSSNSLVGKLIRQGNRNIKTTFEALLNRETIYCPIDEQIVYNQLDDNDAAIWSLLLASGYLKVMSYEEKSEEGNDNGSMAGILSTPNSRGKIIITQLLSLYIWLSAFGSGRCIFYKERFDIVRGANQSVTLLFRHIKIVNLHKIK